jgi:hypothetical protein
MQVLMPRFYFHIYQNGACIRDEEGAICADLEAAKREAVISASDFASQALAEVHSVDEVCVEICDEQDQVLAGLTIRDILSTPADPCFGSGKRLLH